MNMYYLAYIICIALLEHLLMYKLLIALHVAQLVLVLITATRC